MYNAALLSILSVAPGDGKVIAFDYDIIIRSAMHTFILMPLLILLPLLIAIIILVLHARKKKKQSDHK